MIKLNPGTRRLLRASLFEASFVVLGVVLALLANEWRLAAADAERAATARAGILRELAANREAVAGALAYHQRLLASLRESHGKEPPPLAAYSRGFVAPARLSSSAWQSAFATGAMVHLAFDDVFALSRLYALQERYDDQARSIGAVLYGEIAREGIGALAQRPANLASLIGMFAHRESELIAEYDRATRP